MPDRDAVLAHRDCVCWKTPLTRRERKFLIFFQSAFPVPMGFHAVCFRRRRPAYISPVLIPSSTRPRPPSTTRKLLPIRASLSSTPGSISWSRAHCMAADIGAGKGLAGPLSYFADGKG